MSHTHPISPSSALLAAAFTFAPLALAAQCGSPIPGTSGNPIPLTIGTPSECTMNSLPVPPLTADYQSGVTPLGCGATQQRDAWFRFTANSAETLVRIYGNTSLGTGFMVYDGPCGTTMNLMDCAGYDTAFTTGMVAAIVPTVPGTQYHVRVSRLGSDALSATLRICGWDYPRTPDRPACDGNGSFESGTTEGWTCRYGHGNTDFTMDLPNTGCLNPDGLDAPLSPGSGTVQPWNGGNRHTIISDKRYLDPRTNYTVPGVAPGGGNFSFRIGNNDHGCGTAGDAPCPSQASSMSLSMEVTPQNAMFTFMFAVVMQSTGGQYPPYELPRFEVIVTDAVGRFVNCGYGFVLPIDDPGPSPRGPDDWWYQPWTKVPLDLTDHIGHAVAIEFRVTNSYPSVDVPSCSCSNNNCTVTGLSSGGVRYNCSNVTSCSPANPASNPNCTPAGPETYNAGPHSAYAYIDTYCGPFEPGGLEPQFCTYCGPIDTGDLEMRFCRNAATLEICAPPGYVDYVWPPNQPGLTPPLNQRCVTVQGPVDSTVYTVNMRMINSCSGSRTLTLRLDPDCTVGIEEAPPPAGLELFPNPTGDRLAFKLDPSMRVESLRVMDAQGRTVLERAGGPQREVEVATLAPGVYTVRVETDRGTMTGRFLKE